MKPSLDVVFATYSGLPDGDPDDLLALSLLEAKGLRVAVVDWRRVSPNELDSRLVVLRSTWDYHFYYREFLDWVDAVASRTIIRNVRNLTGWNANKKYLLDVARWGVPVVPTVYIDESRANDIDEPAMVAVLERAEFGCSDQIIVKPAVGLSTYGVKSFARAANKAAEIGAHVTALAGSSDVLIQPYLTAVEKYGERSLVFIDNRFSHSVRKSPFQKMAAAGDAGETSVTASAGEIAFGQNVLSKLKQAKGAETLYARVDVVPDESGQLMLLELELIEPSLYLAMDPHAGSRFAAAIAAVLD